MNHIAVIGGGPAGAHAAAELARRGHEITVYDERLAWEKPCGGGLTDKAVRQFPFLGGAAGDCNLVRVCTLTSPDGRTARLRLDAPLAIYARRNLNGLLLQRAEAAGAKLRRVRVVAAEVQSNGWNLRLAGGAIETASAVVVTAGARNALPGLCAEWEPADLMATAGYYIPLARLPWAKDEIVIQFPPGLAGYIWSFPRGDHASVGICGGMAGESTASLKQRLHAFLAENGVDLAGATFYGHLLPAPRRATLRAARFESASGARWARAGDAAGLVDALTGEGLYYALRSAELLASNWREPGGYSLALRRELLPELEMAARLAPRFYAGRFAGGAVLDRLTLFTARSERFRRLLGDLIGGAQGYLGLRARLYRNLLPALAEMAWARAD